MRLEEGPYNFWFSRDGYLSTQVRGKSITATSENAVEVRLAPAVEISGRVTRGGVGVADVEVGAEGTRSVATTAPDGSFALGSLAPGGTRLDLRKRAELIFEKRIHTAPARGVTIDLPPGGTIRGRVVEKGTKTPIRSFRAGVLVGPQDRRSFSSEDGSFTLDHVPAGEITVAVNAFGYLDTYTDVVVVDGKSLTDLVVELDTGVRLTGTVTDANGAPLSGVSITIGSPPMEGGIIFGGPLNAKRAKPAPSNKSASTVTDANGRYALGGLVPGEERVYFSHPGHAGTARKVTLEGRETKLDVQLSPPAL
jgi:hypothetical protein